jgi:hypothetical protein
MTTRLPQDKSSSPIRQRIITATTSLLLVLLAVAYVFAPHDDQLTVTVRETSNTVPLQTTMLARQKPETHGCRTCSEVIYGTISAGRGIHVSAVTITLRGQQRNHDKARITVAGTGTYRKVVHIASGRYSLTVAARIGRRWVSMTRQVRIRTGHAYQVSVRVRSSGLFIPLPITSY